MYLELFHGRPDPDEDMNDWGCEGPIFECEHVHFTYLCSLRLLNPVVTNETRNGDKHGEIFLAIYEDMVYYDGVFYGDVFTFDEIPDGHEGQLVDLDPEKVDLPEKYRKISEQRQRAKNMQIDGARIREMLQELAGKKRTVKKYLEEYEERYGEQYDASKNI